MEDLWDTLHNTYNAAHDRAVDLSLLDELDETPVRQWNNISQKELLEALGGCSNGSAPGPDHVTWQHWKVLCLNSGVTELLVRLGNACINVVHWPKYLKRSNSVIIPKPNKPTYSVAKAYRPIVLLNTLGKLYEKVISKCIQFDASKLDIFHPNQLGGIQQRSTEDAGLILTHIIKQDGVKG